MLFVASAIGFNVNAQTDVTSTYLTNADFEGEKTIQQDLNGGDRCIYKPTGWTVTYSNGDKYDMTAMKEGDKAWNTFRNTSVNPPTGDPLCELPVNGGTQSYFMRFRWSGPTIKISQTTSSALPAGTYRVSADAYRTGGNGTATLSAGGKSVTVDTRNRWANYSVIFTLTEATSIEISLTFTGSADKAVAGVDNFKIENITQGASDLSHDWTTTIANAGFELGSPNHSANSFTAPYGYTMAQVAAGWKDGAINTTNPSEGTKLYNYYSDDITSLDFYQRVTLPAGKYTISADLRTEKSTQITDQGVYAKIGSETFKSGTIQTIGNPWNGAEAWNNLSKDFYVQSDGTVQLGASSTGSGTNGWFQIDNFQLTYKGAVQNTPYSVAQGAATAITSDKWYAVTVPADGEYRIISSVDNTVYYTQNGYYAPSDAESIAVTAGVKQVVNLTTGTLYVRVANDANLTVEPDTYTYSVGGATLSVADGGYTQSQTFTVTFLSATTNDPSASCALVAESTATVNGNSVNLSAVTNGFSLDLGSLTVNSDYVINIPADVYGYVGNSMNSAISLALHTPDLFDGTYFISDGTKYISRGGDSNTEAVLDEYGIAATFSTNASNVTTIVFVDNEKNLFGGSESIYTDKNYSDLEGEGAGKGQRIYWTISKVTGGYKFYNNNSSKYIKWGTSVEDTHAYAAIYATDAEDAGIWTLVAPAAHAATMATYKDVNATAVATAAGLSAATVTELKAIIEGAEWTSKNITVTDAITSVHEKFQLVDYSETPFSENLTGLENGIYKVKLSVFKRIAGNDDTYALYNKNQDSPTAYLFAGDNKAQVPSVMSEYSTEAYTGGWASNWAKDGKNYPNNTTNAGQAFDAGRYTLEVFAYVSDGTLNIGLKNPAKYENSNWLCYRDLKVTYYQNNGPEIISEDVDYTPAAMTAYVTLNRTIKADTWNTFVVPFDISNEELVAKFGAGVAVAEYSEVADGDNSTVSFTTMATPAVAANTPVLLKTSTAGTSYTFPARSIVAGEAKVTGTNFDFVGNYNASLALVNGDYFISSDKLYKKGESATVTLKGTRAYIQPKSVGVKVLNFIIGDEIVTGVDSVEDAEAKAEEDGILYNTAGQVVTEDYKGIVIKNGKKYYQK